MARCRCVVSPTLNDLWDELSLGKIWECSLRDPKALLELAASIRATGAQTLVYMTARQSLFPVVRDIAFFRLAGIQRIIGAPLKPDQREARTDFERGVEEPVSVVRSFETDGGVNYRSDRLI